MKYYDNHDNFRKRIHSIRVTFQSGGYTGHITYQMGGYCFGLYLLNFDPDCVGSDEIENYTENDCKFNFDDDEEVFGLILHDEKGNELICERDSEGLKDFIVTIEIVNCEVEGKVYEQDKN